MARKIRKGDNIVVIAGKNKGQSGEVTRYDTKSQRVLVSGVNMITKHVRPSAASQGGRIQTEAPIHVSNVAIDGGDGKPSRVGFREENGRKVRYAKRTHSVIEDK